MPVERAAADRASLSQATRSFGPVRQILLSTAAVLLALGMIYYYLGVLIPLRQKEFRVANAPAGNWSDVYPQWLGARELLLHRRNPYSREVTQEIQRGFYGRVLDPSNPHEPPNQEGFVFPVYVAFLLAPSVGFPFAAVRAVFIVLIVLLTACSVPLWLRVLRLRLRIFPVLLALVATMSSYPVIDGIHLDQMTLFVAGIIAISLAAVAGGRLALAGVLLALATVKPQLVFLLVPWLLLWTLGAWRSRRAFALGFAITIAALLVGAVLVLPGWFGMWRQASQVYLAYVPPSILVGLLGRNAGTAISGLAVLAALVLFWRVRREAPGKPGFNLGLVTAPVLSTLLIPNAGAAKYNLVLLIPAVLWLFTSAAVFKKASALASLTWVIAANLLVWEWILALAVSFAALVLRHNFQREATLFVAAPEILVFLFPLGLALFVLSAGLQRLQPVSTA